MPKPRPLLIALSFLVATSLSTANNFDTIYQDETKKESNFFDSVFIFGDSLSDQGGELGRFDRFLAGGFDARNYVEIITPILTNQPARPSTEGGNNYAQSSARPLESERNTYNQINRYLRDHNDIADPNALYIINIGGNDLWGSSVILTELIPYYVKKFLDIPFSLEGKLPGPQAVVNQMNILNSKGAEHFLIPNLWHISYSPYFAYQIPATIIPFILTDLFNREVSSFVGLGLNYLLDKEIRSMPDLDGGGGPDFVKEKSLELVFKELPRILQPIKRVLYRMDSEYADAFGEEYFNLVKVGLEKSRANILYADIKLLYDEIYLDPKSFGIDNILLTECNVGVSSGSTLCDKQKLGHKDRVYLWSDWVHPSAAANRIIADYYLSLINAPSYVASFHNQLQTLGKSSQSFIFNQLNQLRYEDKSPSEHKNIFVGISVLRSNYNSYLKNNKLNNVILHLGTYAQLTPKNLIGISLSTSHKKLHPYNKFHFHYEHVAINVFHQFKKQRFWMQNQIQISRMRAKNIRRNIVLGDLFRTEKAKSALSSYYGLYSTSGYDFFKTEKNILGGFLSLNLENYKTKSYSEQDDNSTSMRFSGTQVHKTSGTVGLYHHLSSKNEDRPWKLHSTIAYNFTPRKTYEILTNVKTFANNYTARVQRPVKGWLVLSTAVDYQIKPKTNLNLALGYQKANKKNYITEIQLGLRHKF